MSSYSFAKLFLVICLISCSCSIITGQTWDRIAVGTDLNLESSTKVKITSGWGDWIQLRKNSGTDLGYWGFHNPEDMNTMGIYYKYSGGTYNFGIMTFFEDGRVVLGNVNPLTSSAPYKLFVKGGILTEKVKVAIATEEWWADYVFNENYKLRSLEELDLFIKANNYLPDMPTSKQLYQSGGIDITEMMKLQQQKIEELTLYIIDLNKRIQSLENE